MARVPSVHARRKGSLSGARGRIHSRQYVPRCYMICSRALKAFHLVRTSQTTFDRILRDKEMSVTKTFDSSRFACCHWRLETVICVLRGPEFGSG